MEVDVDERVKKLDVSVSLVLYVEEKEQETQNIKDIS
jgi:hypothetical protein